MSTCRKRHLWRTVGCVINWKFNLRIGYRLNSSATSDPKALNEKVKHVSKSMTSVLKDKEIYVIPLDALEDANHKEFKVLRL